MRKYIKYIGFYYLQNDRFKRNGSLAAINKMDYIVSAIIKTGKKVNVISPAWYIDVNAPFSKTKDKEVSENIRLTQVFSYPTKNKITRYIKNVLSRLWIFIYLLINVKKDEEIIVYHSLALIMPVLWAKRLKNFKLILEVEEIYTDVINYGRSKRKAEFNIFRTADKYIFPTELLNEKLNIKNKPYSIIYGTYKVEEDKKCKFNDGKIHCIYAGTFEPKKGGALAAVKTAEFLNGNYHIHIIGFGGKEDENNLKNLISEVSHKTECTITYDGLLSGNDYIEFLQKCDIGLSTQNPNAEYNDTSFPSKVLSYMANGLRVVSIRIKALEKSAIGDLLYFYDIDDPEEISNAIKSIDLNDEYDSRSRIRELHKEFEEKLKKLLGGKNYETILN